jgi:hypothetical protein
LIQCPVKFTSILQTWKSVTYSRWQKLDHSWDYRPVWAKSSVFFFHHYQLRSTVQPCQIKGTRKIKYLEHCFPNLILHKIIWGTFKKFRYLGIACHSVPTTFYRKDWCSRSSLGDLESMQQSKSSAPFWISTHIMQLWLLSHSNVK